MSRAWGGWRTQLFASIALVLWTGFSGYITGLPFLLVTFLTGFIAGVAALFVWWTPWGKWFPVAAAVLIAPTTITGFVVLGFIPLGLQIGAAVAAFSADAEP